MFRALCILILVTIASSASAANVRVGVVSIDGAINPVTSAYLSRSLSEASNRGEQLLVIQLDTPGGLDTAMRESVKSIFSSRIPVVVHVAPSGARAASAGAVIALAADVCAMAPGTNIGAAHPVSLGEKQDKVMSEKVLNDAEAYVEGIAVKKGRNPDLAKRMVRESASFSAEKAVEGKIADIIAADRTDLLARLDGLQFRRGDTPTVLRTAGAEVVIHQMTIREKILDVIGNPNIAYLLMMLGFLGIFFELSNPGVILPGVVGAISLIISFFSLQTLPVNYAGILLILLAGILFIAETQVVSHGVLALGGIVSLVLGSLLLFPSSDPGFRLSLSVLVGTVTVTGSFFLWIVYRGVQAHRKPPSTGVEGLAGETGVADSDISTEGKVVIHGEYWNAWSDEPIPRGERVRVVSVEGLRLKVRQERRKAGTEIRSGDRGRNEEKG